MKKWLATRLDWFDAQCERPWGAAMVISLTVLAAVYLLSCFATHQFEEPPTVAVRTVAQGGGR